MERYKITDKDIRTYQGFQWVVGKWVKTSGKGKLCSKNWIHVYAHPLLAVLHNPIHGGYNPIRLWMCEVKGRCNTEGQMKEGWSKVRLVKEIDVPEFSIEQRIAYGIKCALSVYAEKSFVKWAEEWLLGNDRSVTRAAEAARAARVEEAARGAWAATEAVGAAEAAWAAAEATWAAEAIRTGAEAAWAAAEAAEAVAEAAKAVEARIDLISIAEEVYSQAY